jgi:hypothetical protein
MRDDLLARFDGAWEGEETIATTRWGEGGPALAQINARLALGGRVLLMDYRETRDGQPALQAHAVFADGASPGDFALHWFDSYGFTPAEPAPGYRDGDRLVFVRSSSRGQTRHVYHWLGNDEFTLVLESSFDGGTSWEKVMQGSYRRVP